MSVARISRAQCANCTCSPGLLSKQNRRTSWMAKQLSTKAKRNSGVLTPTSRYGRADSTFTFEASTICSEQAKEMNTSQRLAKLRTIMAQNDIGVYIVPSEDEHQSEYVSLSDQRRSFISGFSGSAGIAIVTRDLLCMNEVPEGLSALSTDGRYFNQATNELDFNWLLLKQGAQNEPTWQEWTVIQAVQMSLDSGSVVKIGIDPKLITYQGYQLFQRLIKEKLDVKQNSKARVEFVASENLIDQIWGDFEDIPPRSKNPIKLLDDKFSGVKTQDKLKSVKQSLAELNTNTIVITALDEIAWFLNLRGADIDYNPVFYSYLIINGDKVIFYTDSAKLDVGVEDYLKENSIEIKNYFQFWEDLKMISHALTLKNEDIVVPETSSWEVVRNISSGYKQIRSPLEELKAIKSAAELEGAKKAHLKDGRALIQFFAWLEDQLINENELIDEVQADEKLTEYRQKEENFVGLSFETISSTGANAAIIHYAPKKNDCSVIDPNKIYLNDSGSQFLEGTTDTTRTLHFSTPPQVQIDNYTLVLKGNISLAKLKFPEGTTGAIIDSIARQHLWSYGLDYRHGTGHGVGAYLNVHEGPIGIGFRPYCATASLKAGNLLSNEPGYYEDGEYGIRIENVMFVKESGLTFGDKKFLEFETVTRVPFCKKLINVKMLNEDEKEWVNEYHNSVWKEISDSFDKHSYVYNWLKRETSPL